MVRVAGSESFELRLREDIRMPVHVYLKWMRVRRKLREEAGRPLQDWECLEAVFDAALPPEHDTVARGPES